MGGSALTRWQGPCSLGLTPLLGTSSLPLTACPGRREQDWNIYNVFKEWKSLLGRGKQRRALGAISSRSYLQSCPERRKQSQIPSVLPTGHDLHSQHLQVSPLLPMYFLSKGRAHGHSTRPRGEMGMSGGSSKSTVPASPWDTLLAQAQVQLHPYSDPPALCTWSLGES